MQQSAEVRDAMLRFYDRLSASDAASFDQLVSQEPATLVSGTAPGEWVTEHDRMRLASRPRVSASRQGNRPATRKAPGLGRRHCTSCHGKAEAIPTETEFVSHGVVTARPYSGSSAVVHGR